MYGLLQVLLSPAKLDASVEESVSIDSSRHPELPRGSLIVCGKEKRSSVQALVKDVNLSDIVLEASSEGSIRTKDALAQRHTCLPHSSFLSPPNSVPRDVCCSMYGLCYV